MTKYLYLWCAVLVLAAIALSYAMLDHPLIHRLRPDRIKSEIATHAPPLKSVLMEPVGSSSSCWSIRMDWPPLLSALSPWILMGALLMPKGRGRDFLLLLGLSILLTFALKNELKWVFGRTWPRDPASGIHGAVTGGFHWFHGKLFLGSEETGAFPSGHTAIAFAALLPLGLYCRSLMPWCLIIAAMEGIALTILGYHFLSDVLAGALLGIVCTAAASAILQLQPSGDAAKAS